MAQNQISRAERPDEVTGRIAHKPRPKVAAVGTAGVALVALTACDDAHKVPEGSVVQTFEEEPEEVEQ